MAFAIERVGDWTAEHTFTVEAARVKAYAAATNDPVNASGDVAPTDRGPQANRTNEETGRNDPAEVAKNEAPKNPPGKDSKEQANDSNKGASDPPVPGSDPKSLKVPDDAGSAGKLAFLEGKWKAGEGLADS